MIENWLPVVGYEGLYEISDQGRAQSLDHCVHNGRWPGAPDRLIHGRILTPGLTSDGQYLTVHLSKNNVVKTWKIDHLMLGAFVGPRPFSMDSCHWDDDGHNNKLINLRWDTRTNNHLDAVRNGTHHQASKNTCPQGHDYDPATTGRGRRCKECPREQKRDYMRRRRAVS